MPTPNATPAIDLFRDRETEPAAELETELETGLETGLVDRLTTRPHLQIASPDAI
jgi:hypothetical protein